MPQTPNEKTLRVIKFERQGCPACEWMRDRRVLELLVEDEPTVELEVVDVDTPEGSARADKYEVESIPTIIVEPHEGGDVLARRDEMISLAEGRLLVQEAMEAMG